jgi:hypothetical protein
VDAIGRLAEAVRDIAYDPDTLARAARIEALASRLDGTADASDAADSVVVLTALREGIEALESVLGAPARRAADARAALARFDPRRPLLSQTALVREVLGEVANGLLVARDLAPAVAASLAREPIRPATGDHISIDTARRASERVSVLATSSAGDLPDALTATLLAFADAVEPVASGGPLAAAIRSDTARIREAMAPDLDAVPWAKDALSSTLDGIERVTPRSRPEIVTDWISRARAAVSALTDGSLLSFQRGPVQEACRLIADALLFLAATDARKPTAGR